MPRRPRKAVAGRMAVKLPTAEVMMNTQGIQSGMGGCRAWRSESLNFSTNSRCFSCAAAAEARAWGIRLSATSTRVDEVDEPCRQSCEQAVEFGPQLRHVAVSIPL